MTPTRLRGAKADSDVMNSPLFARHGRAQRSAQDGLNESETHRR
jgi:hypothetical protein